MLPKIVKGYLGQVLGWQNSDEAVTPEHHSARELTSVSS